MLKLRMLLLHLNLSGRRHCCSINRHGQLLLEARVLYELHLLPTNDILCFRLNQEFCSDLLQLFLKLEDRLIKIINYFSNIKKKSKEFFSFACASCRHPTEQMNSVAALESSIPSYAERKRICFNCVMTDEYLKERLKISSHDESIARKVKSGEIKGG